MPFEVQFFCFLLKSSKILKNKYTSDILGTWSNGDHMTFLGGYGGQLGAEQQFSMDTATMFGAGGGFGAFTQPAG